MKLTWADAIKKVMQEEGRALHYDEIVGKIVQNEYRQKVGATPAATVISIITTDINKNGEASAFIRVNPGEYFLRNGVVIPAINVPPTKEQEIAEQQKIEVDTKSLSKGNLIKAYGMFWERNNILWKSNPTILGVQIRDKGTTPVDFSSQIGIYLLYDAREVIYVGQAVDQTIGQRLLQHNRGRLAGRWNRFSWFGFKQVNQDGSFSDLPVPISTIASELITTIEAILIEALEPRQNRRGGDFFEGLEFIQEIDTEIQRQKDKAYFKEIEARLANS